MSPTHYCTECGALWRQCDDGSWNLRSDKAGQCCDNAAMGEQIKPLAAPSAQPDLEDYERWLDERLERSVALASAHTTPSARPAEHKGCDYIAPLGSLCRKCGHVHGQRYTFWTGDGEAAMQPDPNDNWLWIGDPAKAPKGL